MNKIPNRQAICETLMEKVKEDKRDRYRGAESGKYFRRPCQMRQETVLFLPGQLHFHKKL